MKLKMRQHEADSQPVLSSLAPRSVVNPLADSGHEQHRKSFLSSAPGPISKVAHVNRIAYEYVEGLTCCILTWDPRHGFKINVKEEHVKSTALQLISKFIRFLTILKIFVKKCTTVNLYKLHAGRMNGSVWTVVLVVRELENSKFGFPFPDEYIFAVQPISSPAKLRLARICNWQPQI